MKKLIVGMVATVMVAAGLVAASGTSASAAPYPGTVQTRTSAVGLGPFTGKAKVYVRVISDSGKPKGTVNLTFVNRKSGASTSFNRDYGGSAKTYTFDVNKGRYSVLVTFVPPDDSKWKPSTAKTKVRVK